MTKIISLTGDLGSGKSTVSALLRKRLGYDYVYTGSIQRAIAERHGMTTLQLNQYAETHPEIDEEIDATFKSLNSSTELIVDSRLAWFFVPASFKVFLKTNLAVSADRITCDNERKNEKYASKEEAASNIVARKTSENKRYMELYGADCADLSNFNLVIDTSFISPERVAEVILAEYEAWLASGECAKALVSPVNLYPTKSVDTQENSDYEANVPVEVISINSYDFILDGHKRTSCAIKNKIDLIPIIYRNEKKESVLQSAKSSFFHDWETFHSFKYLIYPPEII